MTASSSLPGSRATNGTPVRPALAAPIALAALLLTGCAGAARADTAPDLRVTGAYVPQAALGDMTAGYFTVTNHGRPDDRLTSVTSDVASMVTMHTTNASGEMLPISSYDIPAGGSLVLRTGGNHLMLMGLTHKPTAGQTVRFVRHFARCAPITIDAPVEPMGYQPPD